MTRPTHRSTLVAAAMAIAMAAGATSGCSGSDHAAPTTTSSTTTTTIAVADPPTVLDAGAAPRARLRPSMHVGDEVTMRLATDVEVDQSAGGRQQRLDSPPIVQHVRLTVTKANRRGYALHLAVERIEVEGEGSDLTDEQLRALREQLAPLEDLAGTARFDALGRPTALDLDVPKGLAANGRQVLASLRNQLSHLAPALPTEPVGVGARWRTTTAASFPASASAGAGSTSNSFEFQGQTDVTVTAIDHGRVSYDLAVTLSADPQELGSGANLTSGTGKGSGSGWFDLASPAYELDTTSTSTTALVIDGTTVEQTARTVVRARPET